MARLIVLPQARLDLIEIGDFIALDNPERARTFVAEIEASLGRIVERPASFPLRPDLAPGLRAGRHGRYLIFFQEVDQSIIIVRVLHGARDLKQIFDRL